MQISSVTSVAVLFASCLASLVAAGTNEAGLAFLEANKAKPGVLTMPSGLQYKVLQSGTGSSHPTVDSTCTCHYHGTLVDGTVFDSSYDRGEPIDFAPNQVIRGWTEAMQMMVEGDQWELYLPSELAYGDQGSPPKIGGGEVLVFKIEIITIKGDKVPAIKCDAKTKENCNPKETKYIDKVAGWDAAKITSEKERLNKMKSSSMKAELMDWLARRLKLLEQLDSSSAEL